MGAEITQPQPKQQARELRVTGHFSTNAHRDTFIMRLSDHMTQSSQYRWVGRLIKMSYPIIHPIYRQ